MKIRIYLENDIIDGTQLTFRAPADCSQVTGLKVYSPKNGRMVCHQFALADAHGNNVGDIPNLFAKNVLVKVILDITTSMAFVQNADTNAYLEGRFKQLGDNVSSAVSNTDYATYEKAGLVQILPESGFVVDDGGKLRIHPASLGGITNKESLNNPITPATLDFAVRRGLIDPKTVEWTESDRQ